MLSPGESLRQERETRGKTIEEMADATGIRLDFLAAFEQDAFDTLPGRAFGKLYIRAYAEVLGFDPRPVIDAYDRAMNARPAAATPATPASPRPVEAALARWRRERMGEPDPELEELAEEPAEKPAVPEPEPLPAEMAEFEARWAREKWEPAQRVPRPEPKPEPLPKPIQVEEARAEETRAQRPSVPAALSVPSTGFRRWPALAAAVLLVLLVVAGVNAFRSKEEPAEAAPAPTPPIELPKQPPAPPPFTAAPPDEPPRLTPAYPSHLTVSDSGIGERERFRPGQRVTFSTRVLGGRSGEHIRHVWMRDGKVEQSIQLRLAGSNWRTHSTKTVGRPGAWAVEARDDVGRVLARAEFTCVP